MVALFFIVSFTNDEKHPSSSTHPIMPSTEDYGPTHIFGPITCFVGGGMQINDEAAWRVPSIQGNGPSACLPVNVCTGSEIITV